MKKIIIIFLALFFNSAIFAQQHIVEFHISNKNEIRELPAYLSIDNYKDGNVTAYVYGKNFDKFKDLGYKFTEIHAQSRKSVDMATTVAQMDSWDKYPTYSVYVQMMRNFAINYPNICRLDTIGFSQNNRLILAVKISDNPDSLENEPDFFYTSTMHGDETTGYILMLRLIDSLLTSYGTASNITNLINNECIYINPLANPDGTYYGSDTDVSGARRVLANGQDPNRDFPYPEHINSPYSKETLLMMDFANAHNFIVSINFHGGAEVYNFPWDYWYSSENMHADDSWFRHFGQEYVNTARLQNSSYMTDVTSSGVTEGADWYPADGTRQDYMTYYKHCKEVTIELSESKMPASSALPAYWNYNKQSLIDYIQTPLQGFHGIVTNSEGNPLNAKIEIIGFDKDNSWAVTNPINGTYYRPIQPGTYNVSFSANGYRTQTKKIVVADWNSSVVQNVMLLLENRIIVKGSVIDAQTGNFLKDTKIFFKSDSVFENLTDTEGKYFDTIHHNLNTISVFKSGYQPILFDKILLNDTLIDFALLKSNPYSFEHGIPSEFTFSGNAAWTRDSTNAFDSLCSMKSGAIADNQSSIMQLSINTQKGKIYFYKKVSSDTLPDSLIFYIDDIKQQAWTGEDNWSLESFDISAGNHVFKWVYKKNSSGSAGNDCAWIDYVNLPSIEPNTYDVSFSVKDSLSAEPIKGAKIFLTGYGEKLSDALGTATFPSVYETRDTNALSYFVSSDGYFDKTGTLQIHQSINKVINLSSKTVNNNVDIKKIFVIYPNPAQNFITIETDTAPGNLYFFDINGKCVLIKNINSKNTIVAVNNLQKGIYIIKLISDSKIYVAKMIKD